MSPKYISIFLCCFIFGVGLGSLFVFTTQILFTTILTTLFIIMLILVCKKQFGTILLCGLIGLSSGCGYIDKSFSGNEYENLIGQQIDWEGVVVDDPTTNNASGGHESQQLTLLPDHFTQSLNTSLYNPIPDIKQGDRVWIRGQIQMPDNFSEFDYIGYLQRYNVYAVIKKPKVIVLQRAVSSWRAPLLAIRSYIESKTRLYPPNEGSLILGILIGEQQGIPTEIKMAFKRTGLTHIVAVSGFNMTIIATALGALVVFLGRRTTNILTIIVVLAFTVITGVTASVVRAAIMAILMVTAQLSGRQYTSLYALLWVAAIMVLQNPRIVIWDIGFQLSAAATFGVLIAFKIRAKKNPEQTNSGFWSDALRPTLGAIAVTAPIIAIHFQTLSLIAPLANLAVLPFVSWIMLFGGLALLPVVGSVFVYPAQLLASLTIYLTQKFASVPYASININFPAWLWGCYYLVLLIYLYLATKPQLPKPKESGKL